MSVDHHKALHKDCYCAGSSRKGGKHKYIKTLIVLEGPGSDTESE